MWQISDMWGILDFLLYIQKLFSILPYSEGDSTEGRPQPKPKKRPFQWTLTWEKLFLNHFGSHTNSLYFLYEY